jgi:trimethylamine-N-oxide reductase (cytochrome c)
MENDCCFADLIFPVVTKHEMHDISNDMSSGAFTSIYLEGVCCDPIGESKSDFDVCAEVARKVGPDYHKAYTGDFTEEERVRLFYKVSGCEEKMSWEEFSERKIFVVPCLKDALDLPPGLRKFYEDPANNPLTTPTGLLEFTSTAIDKYMPGDPERPPIPKWVERSETHDERLSGDRAKKYSLLCMSNHGRWRMHAQCDDMIWNREVGTMKVRAKDGYQYEPAWLHPVEAAKRGISHGDVVKVFNERGAVLCGAYVTERLSPNVCYVDHGARVDAIIPGELDRGGAINLITPTAMTGKHSTGMATSGFLVEVAKVTDEEMDGWKRDYPAAFARKLDYAAGVILDGWLLES